MDLSNLSGNNWRGAIINDAAIVPGVLNESMLRPDGENTVSQPDVRQGIGADQI